MRIQSINRAIKKAGHSTFIPVCKNNISAGTGSSRSLPSEWRNALANHARSAHNGVVSNTCPACKEIAQRVHDKRVLMGEIASETSRALPPSCDV